MSKGQLKTRTGTYKSVAGQRKKIDLGELIRMKIRGLTNTEIAEKFGCSKMSISTAWQRFRDLMPNPEDIELFEKNKADILNSVELSIIQEMMSKDKLKAASVNNLAYAYNVIHNAHRLEIGKSTSNISQLTKIIEEAGEED